MRLVRPSTPVLIPTVYALFASTWIYVSDRLVARFSSDTHLLRLNTIKGELFVLVTMLLLYGFLRAEARRRAHRDDLVAEAQAALQESERRFRELAELLPQSVFECDVRGTLTFGNRQAYEVTRYTPEDLAAGLNIWQMVIPEEREPLEEDVRQLLGGDYTPGREYTLLRKDGTTVPAAVYAVPIVREGAPAGMRGVFVDITDRKRAEEALTDRTQQLEAVRTVTAEITRELDLPTVLRLITLRACELTAAVGGDLYLWDDSTQTLRPQAAYGQAERRAKAPRQLGEGVIGTVAQRREGVLLNDYRSSPLAHRLTLASTAIKAVLTEPLIYGDRLLGVLGVDHEQDGRTFTPRDQATLKLFAAQAAIAIENARLFEASRHELAERTRAEAALGERNLQLEAIRTVSQELTRELELPELLALIVRHAAALLQTPVGTILLWDEARQSLIIEAAVGVTEGHRGAALPLGDGAPGQAAQTRRGIIINDYPNHPSLTPLAIAFGFTAAVAQPLLYRDTLVGAVVLNHLEPGRCFTQQDSDFLRLFADQAAIAIENARLFKEQKQAYLQLQEAQDQLIRSEKLRALGQLAAGVAHDLNNMLAIILGQAELLRLQTDDPHLDSALKPLETAAADGAQVVRRLQDFSRQRPLGTLTAVSLAALIPEVLEITRPRWRDEPQQRGFTIQIRADLPDLPPVRGHAPEIREALTNLIINAVDAMPHGGTLSFQAKPNGDTLDLVVSDTGIGMSETVRQRIFEPFFTTKGGKGTGLGLAVVYGIMERHEGSVQVQSAPDQGTTFILRFRVATSEALQPTTPSLLAPHPRRILVIDDDEGVRTTVVSLLRAAGHSVSEADGGSQGLAQLSDDVFDLLITDLGMPGMSGWEVAEAVKARSPRLPIVLLTGWGESTHTTSPGAAAVDRILAKPVRLNDLLQIIAELTPPAVPT